MDLKSSSERRYPFADTSGSAFSSSNTQSAADKHLFLIAREEHQSNLLPGGVGGHRSHLGLWASGRGVVAASSVTLDCRISKHFID